MQKRKKTSILPVLNRENIAIGMLRMHDLVKAGL